MDTFCIECVDKKNITKVVDEDLENCCVCFEKYGYGSQLVCGHKFCFDCIQHLDGTTVPIEKSCPFCKGQFKLDYHFKTKEQKIGDDEETGKPQKNDAIIKKKKRKPKTYSIIKVTML